MINAADFYLEAAFPPCKDHFPLASPHNGNYFKRWLINTEWLDFIVLHPWWMCSEVFPLNSHLSPLLNLQLEASSARMEPTLSSELQINQLPFPFVASVRLNEIAWAALHQTIHNDTSSTLNLRRPFHILTTSEDTLNIDSRSLCSFPTALEYCNISKNTLTGFLMLKSVSFIFFSSKRATSHVSLWLSCEA